VGVEELAMNKHIAVLVLATTLLASNAYAQNNEPPPAGPVILNLNGTTPIPQSYQTFNTSFTATSTTSNISFAFREDPAFLSLDNVVVRLGAGPNLLVNGNFDAGPVGGQAPTGWTYLNTFGATFGGVVTAGCGTGGSNCYYDGAVQAYDSITQAITTTPGLLYNISFDLSDNSGLLTFLAISNNGLPGVEGNGINLVVYAGEGEPVRAVPLPAALPLFATGLGALGLLGWRKKRKVTAVAT